MAILTRILVPVEFSPRCQGAIQYAAALARHFQGEIALLHVVVPPSSVYGFSEAAAYTNAPDLQAEIVASRKDQLNTFAAGALQELPVTRVVLEGDPPRLRQPPSARHPRCDWTRCRTFRSTRPTPSFRDAPR